MTRDELIALARQKAAEHQLYPELVCALCEQESPWQPWAIRYEPAFFSKYVAPLLTTGKISATEAYARSMSWGLCISEGELIATESGWKPIETVAVGTRILNRQAALAKVRAVIAKAASPCLQVDLALNPPLVLTADHLVFARKASLSKWHTGRTKIVYEKQPEYLSAEQLSPWDQIAFPRSSPTFPVEAVDAAQYLQTPDVPHRAIEYISKDGWLILSYKHGRERSRVKRHIPITSQFLELLGLYIAEGSRLEKGKGCAFSFHRAEHSLHSRVLQLAANVFGDAPNYRISENPLSNGVQVVLYGPGPRLLTKLIPGTAKTKQIPEWLLWLPPQLQKYLFLGAFLGDGCRKFAKLTTANEQIAYAMAHILLRLGIVPRIVKISSAKRSWYDVSLNSHLAVSKLNAELGDLAQGWQTSQFGLRRRNSTDWDKDLDFVYFPVRRIGQAGARPVFDLDAGDDASFCVGRSIVHNCQIMGQTAREHGFDAPFLSALCDPATGLEIGCRVLARKLAAAEGNVERALLLWNGGANHAYTAQVLVRAERYL